MALLTTDNGQRTTDLAQRGVIALRAGRHRAGRATLPPRHPQAGRPLQPEALCESRHHARIKGRLPRGGGSVPAGDSAGAVGEAVPRGWGTVAHRGQVQGVRGEHSSSRSGSSRRLSPGTPSRPPSTAWRNGTKRAQSCREAIKLNPEFAKAIATLSSLLCAAAWEAGDTWDVIDESIEAADAACHYDLTYENSDLARSPRHQIAGHYDKALTLWDVLQAEGQISQHNRSRPGDDPLDQGRIRRGVRRVSIRLRVGPGQIDLSPGPPPSGTAAPSTARSSCVRPTAMANASSSSGTRDGFVPAADGWLWAA